MHKPVKWVFVYQHNSVSFLFGLFSREMLRIVTYGCPFVYEGHFNALKSIEGLQIFSSVAT